MELDAQPDPHGGWNLHLTTQRFTFTPPDQNGRARAGQGHAHVYVDEQKFPARTGRGSSCLLRRLGTVSTPWR